jgi:hypothetical protein
MKVPWGKKSCPELSPEMSTVPVTLAVRAKVLAAPGVEVGLWFLAEVNPAGSVVVQTLAQSSPLPWTFADGEVGVGIRLAAPLA